MAEATPQVPVNNSGRLKYADPRTLPSFPSTGLKPDGAAAGAAATLGWNNQKPIELWKPDKLSSASAAAVLAKDYKMAPQWQPDSGSDGHKAALLAVGSASSALKHQPSSSSNKHEGWGNSAATQAFHASRPTSIQSNDLSHGNTAATQAFNTNRSMSVRNSTMTSPPPAHGDRSLLAAKGAMASSRPRATSVPSASEPSSDSRLDTRAAANALNGASVAHRASMQAKPPTDNAGAVPVTTMTRNMFTSRPLVKPEADERQDAERLHQSAVEMAKKMYNQQQKMVEQVKAQGGDPDRMSMPALNLQDAAYKQAQNRLSKLQDEHLQSRDMQEYYGNAQQAPRRRWTVTNKLRRKDSDEDFDDHEESAKIRQQMSMFSKQLTEVDRTKRQEDRDNLLAAAQRNVKARLLGMDEKVYSDTGKVNPTLLSDWEVKAQQAAQVRHQTRGENSGKLNLGGGMYMDQDAVDAIAAKRMQPVLDDINEKAEKERERLATLKMEEDARKSEMEREREREREMKDLQKRVKEEDKQDQKARKMQEKEEQKARKEREKAEKAEQKRMSKDAKRRSKHDSGVIADAGGDEEREAQREDEPTATSAVAPALERYLDDDELRDTTRRSASIEETREPVRRSASIEEPRTTTTVSAGTPAIDTTVNDTTVGTSAPEAENEQAQSPKDPSSPGSKVKGWIRNRLSRGKSVSEKRNKGEEEANDAEQSSKEEKRSRRKSLFGRGGAALKKKKHPNASTTSVENRNSSMRDVATAGRANEDAGQRDSRGVSPVSSVADEDETRSRRDRDSGMEMLAPRPLDDNPARSSISPNRDSRFREEM